MAGAHSAAVEVLVRQEQHARAGWTLGTKNSANERVATWGGTVSHAREASTAKKNAVPQARTMRLGEESSTALLTSRRGVAFEGRARILDAV